MIRVNDSITIPESDLSFAYTRSSGPGGQHVNTTDTAVQLRYDLTNSTVLPGSVKHRLRALAGRRLGADGCLLITSQQHRSRQRNVEDACERLAGLIREAAIPPKRRRPTRPSAAAKERRIQGKKKRSIVKRHRGRPDDSG